MNPDEAFATLRQLLTWTPSSLHFRYITEHLDQWPHDDDTLDLALKYADEHLASWGEAHRTAPLWMCWPQGPPHPPSLSLPLLRCLEIENEDVRLGALLRSKQLQDIAVLHLCSRLLRPEEQGQMCLSMPSLTRLFIQDCGLDAAGATALAQSHTPRLLTVDLSYNDIGVEGLEQLTSSPFFAGVRSLELQGNGLDSRGLELLAACPHLSELETLKFGDPDIDARGLQALAQSPYLTGLKRLNLGSTPIDEAIAEVLAQTPRWASLRELVLSEQQVLSAGIRTTLGLSPHLGHAIRRSFLKSCSHQELLATDDPQGGPDEADPLPRYLSKSGLLTLLLDRKPTPRTQRPRAMRFAWLLEGFVEGRRRLEELEALQERLRTWPDDARRARISSWPAAFDQGLPGYFELVRGLDLSGCQIGTQGLQALAQSPHLSQLRQLWLDGNTLDAEAFAALCSSPYLGQLRLLSMCDVDGAETWDWSCLQAATWSHLEALQLNGLPIGDTAAYSMAQCPALRGLKTLHICQKQERIWHSPQPKEPGRTYRRHSDDAISKPAALALVSAFTGLQELKIRGISIGPTDAIIPHFLEQCWN